MALAGAVALAGVTATSAPARASDDLVRFLAGATALAIIVAAVDDRRRARHVGHRVLPGACLETARVSGRSVQMYNARCLQSAGYHRLPGQCQVSLRTRHGQRAGYVADCMRRNGYRAEGHTLRPTDRHAHRPSHTRPSHTRPSHTRPSHTRPGGHRAGHAPRRHTIQLPARCEMHYRQGGQRVWGFDGSCLSRHGHSNLPRQCRVQDRAGRSYFNGQCLTHAGFRRGR